jgi:hypothetical protein
MADHLKYDYNDIQETIDRVTTELGNFNQTLEEFGTAYRRLASTWGGEASRNAEFEAGRIKNFGVETANICKTFLDRYTEHFAHAQYTENSIANQFA